MFRGRRLMAMIPLSLEDTFLDEQGVHETNLRADVQDEVRRLQVHRCLGGPLELRHQAVQSFLVFHALLAFARRIANGIYKGA